MIDSIKLRRFKRLIACLLFTFCLVSCNGQEATGQFTLVSYNVRHCLGNDGVIDYSRIACIINALQPDVVCLQELDQLNDRTPENQIDTLATKTGMHGCFGKAINYKNGAYGIGILSKQKTVATYQYPLPGAEKRVMLIAEFDNYLVCCTHLDLKETNRIASIGIINEQVKRLGKPAYLAGDLNETERYGAFFTEMEKQWKVNSCVENTFPTPLANRCIDYILTYNNGTNYGKFSSEVVYSLPNCDIENASDHFPIIVKR